MTGRHGRSLVLAALMALGACAPGPEAAAPTVPSPTTPIGPSPSPAIQDIMELDPFAPLEPGTYFIDPDLDPSTPLRIVYEIPTEGWQQWIGAVRFAEDGHVGLSITTVSNLVTTGVATIRGPIHPSDRAWPTSLPRWRIWLRSG